MIDNRYSVCKSIGFSCWYSKLENDIFSTIRRYDKYRINGIYLINTPKGSFHAKLYLKEKLSLKELSTAFLLSDTDCESRFKAIELLNSFYKNPILEDEKLTILHLTKNW